MNATNSRVRKPRCVRIFRSYDEARFAQDILAKAGIPPRIKEDRFGTLTLKELNMQSRFRLYISMEDINKAGAFLAKELSRRWAAKQ